MGKRGPGCPCLVPGRRSLRTLCPMRTQGGRLLLLAGRWLSLAAGLLGQLPSPSPGHPAAAGPRGGKESGCQRPRADPLCFLGRLAPLTLN